MFGCFWMNRNKIVLKKNEVKANQQANEVTSEAGTQITITWNRERANETLEASDKNPFNKIHMVITFFFPVSFNFLSFFIALFPSFQLVKRTFFFSFYLFFPPHFFFFYLEFTLLFARCFFFASIVCSLSALLLCGLNRFWK